MTSLLNAHGFNRPIDPGGFCYLCGKPLGDDTNTQHVVPKGLFRPQDRTPLLILVAHVACNASESANDQEIGQLVSLLWRAPSDVPRHSEKLRKRVSVHPMPGSLVPQGAVEWLPLQQIIFRWIQGFHAALYREFLDPAGHFVVQEPFPSGEQLGHVYPIPPWHKPFVEVLKRNRAAGSLDRLELPNGKLRYHCVWVEDDNGIDLCVFALDIYGWSGLGDIHRHNERSCVGAYARSRPENATRGTSSKLEVANTCPLDAFAD